MIGDEAMDNGTARIENARWLQFELSVAKRSARPQWRKRLSKNDLLVN